MPDRSIKYYDEKLFGKRKKVLLIKKGKIKGFVTEDFVAKNWGAIMGINKKKIQKGINKLTRGLSKVASKSGEAAVGLAKGVEELQKRSRERRRESAKIELEELALERKLLKSRRATKKLRDYDDDDFLGLSFPSGDDFITGNVRRKRKRW